MTPIRISKRSVFVITSLFLILVLGICILPATPANAFDQYLPRMDAQQKPVDGDPDEPSDINANGMLGQAVFDQPEIRLVIRILSTAFEVVGI